MIRMSYNPLMRITAVRTWPWFDADNAVVEFQSPPKDNHSPDTIIDQTNECIFTRSQSPSENNYSPDIKLIHMLRFND